MCEGFSPEHRELQEVTHPPGCGHSLFSGSAREPCLHDFPRQKQECGLDSLGSWGGFAGTADLVVKPCGRFRTPKGSSLSCPGPAVLTAFPVWDMQPLKCLGFSGFAQASSGSAVPSLTTLVLSTTTMVWFFLPFCCWVLKGSRPLW